MDFDYSWEALFHPENLPVFSEPKWVFEYEKSGFSLANAWWLANAAQLAYFDKAQIKSELEKINMELVAFFEKNGSQGFLATENRFAVLAFRGTEIDEFEDTWTDIQFPRVPFEPKGNVHSGFKKAFEQIWDQVEKKLVTLDALGIPCWYTGHSLGAALATLAAARKKPAGLYTFGSPMVGDPYFVQHLRKIAAIRFTLCTDIVPMLPSEMVGYRHCGVHYFMTSQALMLKSPQRKEVFFSKLAGRLRYAAMLPWFKKGMVKARSLADHAIPNYIAAIRKNLERRGSLE